ncbi:MAG TPA: hypothetical protein VLA34_05430, partial [Candidatus Krumholzibacterium sp.]|nr:hypothetical protein [Candidatus Krumholzibacterium sp.]
MPNHPSRSPFSLSAALVVAMLCITAWSVSASETVTPEDMLSVRYCSDATICPCGEWVAYLVSIPREAGDDPGSAYSELHLVSVKTGEHRPFITGRVNISSPRFSPD